VNSATDRDADTRARLRQHWEASERGDLGAEHAIYAADAILDYPQSGERSLSVIEMTDGLVTHETQHFADPFPGPAGHAALAEPIPALEQ
jgi:hypothetical protein